ncbi:uncharacterized protein LOC116344143 [Contarinia nasturtii]|uniref:uncharacterized protein LOC116344143 n=1 Tax=Contarinia nasturtii TaxID=265458 RepID=UPI0012D45673|nr:uncharacterized protein LOC116344143 [Contarinia nasturtii]
MMQPRNRKICLLAFVGTMLLLVSHCKSHQMSISNTWTLPQDGFTVFYRFFRDKISWYEADAVCQFHHANLVTVDNGVKYDASRAYLSDLNVTENVWIGLMRSQNSDRFMWSNSKILDREFGNYWAEQIPAIDSPLCAVVDPTKDYRWHSLRCGGPDVAAFLCEMEAPEWASECLIRALPSLQIQYVADSATIELSRDCGGAEGIKRLTCNGKQDQDVIQRELLCRSERASFTSDNEMKAAAEELPSQNIIEMMTLASSRTDNMENNNIDKIANQIEASVEVDNKFNLDEMMMGDAAAQDDDVKPVKNAKKFTNSEKPLKNQPKQMRKTKSDESNGDDVMMGDQPDSSANSAEDNFKNAKETFITTPKNVVELQRTTIEMRNRRETEIPVNISATTESNIQTETEVMHLPHKEIARDHFIPPMLLVQHQNSTETPLLSSTNGQELDASSANSTSQVNDQEILASSTQQTPVPTTIANDVTTINSSNETLSTTVVSSSFAPNASTTNSSESTTVSTTTSVQIPHEYPKSNMMRPHAPKFGGEISYHAPHIPTTTTKAPTDFIQANDSSIAMETINSTETTITSENVTILSSNSSVKSTEIVIDAATQSINETFTEARHLEVAKRSNSLVAIDKHQHNHEQQHETDSHKRINETKHADFTNAELDYQNFKPNRKRILTKPETHTFIQKVFG